MVYAFSFAPFITALFARRSLKVKVHLSFAGRHHQRNRRSSRTFVVQAYHLSLQVRLPPLELTLLRSGLQLNSFTSAWVDSSPD
jgi:hypothetical protein